MKKAGLSSINIGIETNDIDIAKMNKRKTVEASYQNEIIEYCNNLGIKIIGFFIIGLEGDTASSVREMIQYSLNNIFITAGLILLLICVAWYVISLPSKIPDES